MNAEFFLRTIFGIAIGGLFYFMVLRPLIIRLHQNRKFNKRVKQLKGLGFNIETPIKDPSLSPEEIRLIQSDEVPTDEDILKYYKMYCKKWELDHDDEWTTLKPKTLDYFTERAKTKTEFFVTNDRFGFMLVGGYQFLIRSTCDSMIGFPPNEYYHRYIDYEALVKEDDEKLMQEIEKI